MQASWQVGRLGGIPLRIEPSWLIVLSGVAIANGWDWQQQYPTWNIWAAGGTGLGMALLLFGSVLLHELGQKIAIGWSFLLEIMLDELGYGEVRFYHLSCWVL